MNEKMKSLPHSVIKAILIAVVAGLLLAGLNVASYAQQGGWSEPVLMGPGWFPDIAGDATGRAHVAWSSSVAEIDPNIPSLRPATRSGYDLIYYRYTRDGVEWSDTFDITAFRQLVGSEVTRPAIIIDQEGIMHMTYRYTTVMYSQARADEAASARAWQKPHPLSVEQVAYFSRIAQDGQGRLHVVFTENVMTVDCPICYHLFYRYSDDNGRNWSIRSDVSGLPIGVAKPQMVIDAQDVIHVVWEAGRGGALGQLSDPTTVMYAASYDRGISWTRPHEFVVADGRAKNITIGVDGNGNLVVAWLALPENTIYYQVSRDQGRSWSQAEPVPGVRGGWAVYNALLDDYTMATDSAGNLHLVVVGRTVDEPRTLELVHLTWNRGFWSEPEVITRLVGDAPEWPRIAITNGNRLHVVWFVRDEAHIFDSDRGQYHVWYSNKTVNAPTIAPGAFPTATPVITVAPSPTPSPPTPTPVDPNLAMLPVSPHAAASIYSEFDEMVMMAGALVPAALLILLVIALVRLKKH